MKQALARQYGVVEGSAAAVALEKAHKEEELDDEGNPKKKRKEVTIVLTPASRRHPSTLVDGCLRESVNGMYMMMQQQDMRKVLFYFSLLYY